MSSAGWGGRGRLVGSMQMRAVSRVPCPGRSRSAVALRYVWPGPAGPRPGRGGAPEPLPFFDFDRVSRPTTTAHRVCLSQPAGYKLTVPVRASHRGSAATACRPPPGPPLATAQRSASARGSPGRLRAVRGCARRPSLPTLRALGPGSSPPSPPARGGALSNRVANKTGRSGGRTAPGLAVSSTPPPRSTSGMECYCWLGRVDGFRRAPNC